MGFNITGYTGIEGKTRDQDDKLMMIIISIPIIRIIIIYVSYYYHHPSIITIIILIITISITYELLLLSTLEFDQLQLPKPAGQELLEVEG